ncbi:DUF5998 family protein [Paeniglutamicibacter gangotriensis]|uniref:Cell wall biosynthesis glycosyltransferase n=1 Tax=Paeniglutamicibacter gangotriensis Lz1y TaxID=1276920 RepID=M7N8A3_9MICC|nr:DUF5998 family protein [Paeniglutamicibacter gangotriensis]EMQ98014.1 hypothetical protein ADIAG_02524 [Paeniglutamicibacter gangotriensis Lz1y]
MTPLSSASAPDLHTALTRAGFYPKILADVIDEALDGREPGGHLVHLETHFDQHEVHRHITVLVLAEDVLLVTHVDDQQLDEKGKEVMAQISTELVQLSKVTTVATSYVYHQPQNYRSGDLVKELTLGIAWAGAQRIDLAPAGCPDPECDADHGYTGTSQQEDLVLRVSAEADGANAVAAARSFALAMRRASAPRVTETRVPAPASVSTTEVRGRVGSRFGRNTHQG